MSVQRIDRRENKWTKDSTFGCNCYEHMFPPKRFTARRCYALLTASSQCMTPVPRRPQVLAAHQDRTWLNGKGAVTSSSLIFDMDLCGTMFYRLDGCLNLFWFMQLGLTFKIPLPNLRSWHILRIPEVSIRSLVVTPCIPKTAVSHVFSLFPMLQL